MNTYSRAVFRERGELQHPAESCVLAGPQAACTGDPAPAKMEIGEPRVLS